MTVIDIQRIYIDSQKKKMYQILVDISLTIWILDDQYLQSWAAKGEKINVP